jgi:hypothetical protein
MPCCAAGVKTVIVRAVRTGEYALIVNEEDAFPDPNGSAAHRRCHVILVRLWRGSARSRPKLERNFALRLVKTLPW